MKFDPGQNVNKVLMTMYVHALGEASPNVRQRASVQGAWPHFWDTSENEMVYIYINIYIYRDYTWDRHAWMHETSLHRPISCMHEPSSLSLYIKLIEAFAMWMLGPMHTHVSFFGETYNRQTSPIAFSICLYPLLFFFYIFFKTLFKKIKK